MTRLVISVGGSVLVPTLDTHRLTQWAEVLRLLSKNGHQIFVVVGGGGEARRYIDVCRELGLDEASADEFGIQITRINAKLLVSALGDEYAYPLVPESYQKAKEAALSGKIVVMGGITPGQTTDAVAACLAEEVNAYAMINMTAIDGIYSSDPKKDKNAVKYDALSPQDLISIIIKERMCAGSNMVIDLVAAKITERSNIPLIVIDGRDPKLLCRAIIDGEFYGTIVGTKRISFPF
ncbi:MAG TPA: UMP kinase [Methanocorpusculum sp.]|nr:UMP kinase [Methanocorpusculum sp.]